MTIGLLARLTAAALLMSLGTSAIALEPEADEEARLKACEESVCNIILKKDAKGANPDCNIKKTWARSTIKEGESKMVTWGFGDARCSADLKIERREIVAALTEPRYTLRVPTQTVKCQIMQDGELKPILAKAAPKIKFENGQADKIWINLEKIDGPENVAGTISTIAAMEDKLGIFHKSLVKSVNKFIHKRCAKKYGPDAKAADASAKNKSADSSAKKKPKTDAKPNDNDEAAPPAKAKVTP